MFIRGSENGWELQTIANGKLSCEKCDLEAAAEDIDRVQNSIKQKFGSIIKEEGIIVSWDNWSGIFIMQMPLSKNMSAYFDVSNMGDCYDKY